MSDNEEETQLRQRKPEEQGQGASESEEESSEQLPATQAPVPKFGPLPCFPNQRVWTRIMLIASTMVVVYFTSTPPRLTVLAKQKDQFEYRTQNVACTPNYQSEMDSLPESCRVGDCSITVRDKLVTEVEASGLLALVGRLYKEPNKAVNNPYWISVDAVNKNGGLTQQETALLSLVLAKIQDTVGPPDTVLESLEPSRFYRSTHDAPQQQSDKCQSCHFNAVLYLNDFGTDFEGGRSVFLQPDNTTIVVEPRKGRMVSWTGGALAVVEGISTGTSNSLRLTYKCTGPKSNGEDS